MNHDARDFISPVKSIIKILIFSVYTLSPTISLPIQPVADQSSIPDSEEGLWILCDRPSISSGTVDWYYKCCRNSDKTFFDPAVKRILVHLQCCTSCLILIHEKRSIMQSIPRLITVNTIQWTVENFVDVPSYRVVLNLTTIQIHCYIYPTVITWSSDHRSECSSRTRWIHNRIGK